MNTVKKAFQSDHAKQYDRKAADANWLDPAIVFGMAYKFVHPGDSLLDIGIGTGLSSELFHKAGLQVYGIDFSREMLTCCLSKNMTVEVKEHDLLKSPYPYPSESIHHAVCTGVTHLFENLHPIFKELSRILKDNGIFSFVVADCNEKEKRAVNVKSRHDPKERKVTTYRFSQSDIQAILNEYGFQSLYDLQFEASAIGHQRARYKAYVTRKEDRRRIEE